MVSDAFRRDPMDDPFASQEWRDYAQGVIHNMVPKMKASALVIGMAAKSDEADVKMAVEIGYCLLLGKPLIVMADTITTLPPGLLRAADEVVYGEIQHPSTQKKMQEAITKVMTRLGLKP